MYKLILKNFQPYKNMEFEFKSLTFIIGSSDKGKSAIIRALFWLVGYLDISYTKLKTKNAKGTVSVTLEKDNFSIKKEASDKGIEYVINGQKFERMGTKVPSQVYDLLKISEACFQMQTDPYFLVNKTPTEIYEKLSNPILDNYIIEIQDKYKKVKEKKEFLHEEKDKLQKYINEKEEIEKVAKKYLVVKFTLINKTYKNYVLFLYKKITKLHYLLLQYLKLKKIFVLIQKYNNVIILLQKYTTYKIKILARRLYLKEVVETLINSYKKLADLIVLNRAKKLTQTLDIIEKLLVYYFAIKKEKNQYIHNIIIRLYKVYKLIYVKLLIEEIKTLPDTCPVCGNPLKEGGKVLC